MIVVKIILLVGYVHVKEELCSAMNNAAPENDLGEHGSESLVVQCKFHQFFRMWHEVSWSPISYSSCRVQGSMGTPKCKQVRQPLWRPQSVTLKPRSYRYAIFKWYWWPLEMTQPAWQKTQKAWTQGLAWSEFPSTYIPPCGMHTSTYVTEALMRKA